MSKSGNSTIRRSDDDVKEKVGGGDSKNSKMNKRCSAMQEGTVTAFQNLWTADRDRMFGGFWKSRSHPDGSKATQYWNPNKEKDNLIRQAAYKVVNIMLKNIIS